MKSGGVVKTVAHEAYQILPLEDTSGDCENDRRRWGQAYPGSIARSFWEVMQSTSTRDGNLLFYYTELPLLKPILSSNQGPSQLRTHTNESSQIGRTGRGTARFH